MIYVYLGIITIPFIIVAVLLARAYLNDDEDCEDDAEYWQ